MDQVNAPGFPDLWKNLLVARKLTRILGIPPYRAGRSQISLRVWRWTFLKSQAVFARGPKGALSAEVIEDGPPMRE